MWFIFKKYRYSPVQMTGRYAAGMELLELSTPDALFRADNGVLEVFQLSWENSLRLPFAWLCVKADPPKRDQILLRLGIVSPPGQVLYGADAKVINVYRTILISAADEPRVRAFFTQIAGHAGRLVQP